MTFMEEIVDAAKVYNKDLIKEPILQVNFDKALNNIFSIASQK